MCLQYENSYASLNIVILYKYRVTFISKKFTSLGSHGMMKVPCVGRPSSPAPLTLCSLLQVSCSRLVSDTSTSRCLCTLPSGIFPLRVYQTGKFPLKLISWEYIVKKRESLHSTNNKINSILVEMCRYIHPYIILVQNNIIWHSYLMK